MERFEVQPGAMESVANAFQSAADDLETALEGFQSVVLGLRLLKNHPLPMGTSGRRCSA